MLGDPHGEVFLGDLTCGHALDHFRRLIVFRPGPRMAVTGKQLQHGEEGHTLVPVWKWVIAEQA